MRRTARRQLIRMGAGFFIVAGLLAFSTCVFAQQPIDQETRDSLTQQLNALEKEAAVLDKNIQNLQSQAKTLKNEIALLDNQIKIKRKNQNSRVPQADISASRVVLGSAVRELASRSNDNLVQMILKNDSLSDFFAELNSLEALQKKIQDTLLDLRTHKTALEKEKQDLESYQEEQQQVKSIQEVNRRGLQGKRTERDRITLKILL